MKKILTILSALLIVTGIRAQKANVQKETAKPSADSAIKNNANTQPNKPAVQQKEAKIAPALKYTPAAKVAPVSTKVEKKTSTQQ